LLRQLKANYYIKQSLTQADTFAITNQTHKMNFHIKICLLLLYLITAVTVAAQTKIIPKTKSEIKPIYPTGYTEKIEFYDTTTNTLIRTFEINQENPYNQFPFKIIETSAKKINYYKLPDSVRTKDYFKAVRSKNKGGVSNPGKPAYVTSHVYCSSITPQSKFVVVSYSLLVYNNNRNLISIYTTYKSINHLGEVVETLEHLPVESICYAEISGNGKYLFTSSSSGNKLEEDVGKSPRVSKIEIYDMGRKTKIYTEKIPGTDEPPFPMVVNENMFKIYIDLKADGKTVKIYDIENGWIYEKKYSKKQFQNLIRGESSGLRFAADNQKEILEEYVNFPKRNLVRNGY